jgi:hypothetical protein
MAPLQEGICAFDYAERLAPQTVTDIPEAASSLDVLADATHVYWGTRTGASALKRASRQSGQVEDVPAPNGFYDLLEQGAYIYGWNSRTLFELTKAGGAVRQVGVAKDYPLAGNAALDATAVYFLNSPDNNCEIDRNYRHVQRMSLDTGIETTLDQVGCAVGVAVDDAYVYYATGTDTAVGERELPAVLGELYHLERRPKAGGSPMTLTKNVVHARPDGIDLSFALSGDYLYFKYSTDRLSPRWQLARVSKTGGEPELLSEKPNCFNMEKIAVRGDRVMLNGNQGLAALGVDGTVLFYGSLEGPGGSEFNCALDPSGVYCVQEVDVGSDALVFLKF